MDILNESRETGTPLNSTKGEDDDNDHNESHLKEAFLEELENEMNECENYIDKLKETDIKLLLSARGKGSTSSPTLKFVRRLLRPNVSGQTHTMEKFLQTKLRSVQMLMKKLKKSGIKCQ